MAVSILPVIMSGGSGTRLWPLSIPEKPKQFHALATAHTMIQETALRLSGEGFIAPVAICGIGHRDLVAQQLLDIKIPAQAIILEPFGRNTAAVAAMAALSGLEFAPDALILMVPADHVIRQPEAFHAAITSAAETARERIVTFGITPTYPETGFGYIARGGALRDGIHEIEKFLEKPDLATATGYVNGGKHVWNAGIFLFSPQVMLEELERHAPQVLNACRAAWAGAARDGVAIRLDPGAFAEVPSISVDYAVMEKTRRSAVAPCDIGWADVGGFRELWRIGDKDADGNHVKGDSILIDTRNCLIRNEGVPPVAVIGLSDIMVIATADGIMIAPLDRAQEIKQAAEAAKLRKS